MWLLLYQVFGLDFAGFGRSSGVFERWSHFASDEFVAVLCGDRTMAAGYKFFTA
ncbi:MAG: hypothetical protein HC857_02605 [Synechococcales cyanobacterium RU_4_20]|nr:hypothetical protein [Synechococcales cyanobacterium RU_4_20]